GLVHLAHGIGIGVVPGTEILNRRFLGITVGNGLDQRPFRWRDLVFELGRLRDRVPGLGQRIGFLVVLERFLTCVPNLWRRLKR
ncbi:MAG: hypothetical protein OER56_14485, partial [Hyphomicrobiales bacterium]|nr:hypothetical protein [Hyphomicrobiales bacterium]